MLKVLGTVVTITGLALAGGCGMMGGGNSSSGSSGSSASGSSSVSRCEGMLGEARQRCLGRSGAPADGPRNK